jgi:hypothetical protein
MFNGMRKAAFAVAAVATLFVIPTSAFSNLLRLDREACG